MNDKIITEICIIFDGNYFDKKANQKNAECRFAYCGLLRSQNFSYKEISAATRFSLPMVKVRLNKHRNNYKFNKDYRDKFNKLIEKIK